jgi:flagellar biosynthetic protein FliR
MLLAFLLAPNLPALPEVSLFSWAGLGVTVEQVLIGMSLGHGDARGRWRWWR